MPTLKDLVQELVNLGTATSAATPVVDSFAKKTKEAEKNLGTELVALRAAGKSFTDLKDAMSKGLGTLNSLNTAYKKAAADQKLFNEATEDAKAQVEGLNLSLIKAKRSYENEIKAMRDAGKSSIEITRAMKNQNSALGIAAQKYRELAKEERLLTEATEALSKENKSVSEGIQSVVDKVRGAIGTFGALTGILGVSSLGFRDIASYGIKYNEAMFSLLKTQNAVGGGLQNISKVMETVTKNTNLSRVQFAEFAQIVTDGMIGVKMSLSQVIELSSTLSKIAGPSFDAQKKAAQDLASIQSQFPALYNEIYKGMQLVVKIKEGRGTQDDKDALAAIREQVNAMQDLQGAAIAQISSTRGYLTEQTAAMDEQLEASKKQQELEKQIGELKLKFFESIQPLMKDVLDITSALVEVIKDWANGWTIAFAVGMSQLPKIIGGIGAAKKLYDSWKISTAAMTTAQWALNVAMDANPIGAIIMAIAALITVIGLASVAMYKFFKNKRAEQEKSNKLAKDSLDLQRKEISLTNEQKKAYDELNKNSNLSGKSEEEKLAIKEKNLEAAKQEVEQQKLNQVSQQSLNKDYEAMQAIITKSVDSYGKLVEVSERFGLVNKKALQGLADMSKEAIAPAMAALENQIKVLSNRKDLDIKIDVKMNIEDQANSIIDQLTEQAKAIENIKGMEEEHNKILAARGLMLIQQQKVVGVIADSLMRQRDVSMGELKQAENITSKYESRLDTERKLMEAAQFGLGASITMMQKQVDLAYKLKNTVDQTLEKRRKDVSFLTQGQRTQLENASTQAEVQAALGDKTKYTAEQQQAAALYASDYQELSKKSMDQQQKIYDLTKNIREGYLDAIREMSVGAGEFEKIIGTQTMGTTQLMNAVDKFSKGALNTMGLGGLQSAGTTMAGVGTGVTGGYSANPNKPMASFINQSEQDARNSRIYGYGKQIGGPGEKVGTGVAGGREPQYMQPMREDVNNDLPKTKAEEIKVQETATLNALNKWSKGGKSTEVMWGTQPTQGQGTFGTNEKTGPGPGIPFAGSVAKAAGKQQHPAPGKPIAQPPSAESYKGDADIKKILDRDENRRVDKKIEEDKKQAKWTKDAAEEYKSLRNVGKNKEAERVKEDYLKEHPELKKSMEEKGRNNKDKEKAKKEKLENAESQFQFLNLQGRTKEANALKEKFIKENPEAGFKNREAKVKNQMANAEWKKMETGEKLRDAMGGYSKLSPEQQAAQKKYSAGAATFSGGKGQKMDMGAISTSFSGGGKINAKGMIRDESSSTYQKNKAKAEADAKSSGLNEIKTGDKIVKDATKAESTVKKEAMKSVSAQKQEQANAMGGKEAAYGSGASSQDKVIVEIVMKGAAKDMIDAHQSMSSASKIKSTI